MSNANRLSSQVLIFVVSLALAAAAGIPALGQDAARTPSQGGGYVDDWSFHHLVFSNPGTREDAVTNGKLDKWQKITSDPRYRLQLQKRSMGTLVVTPNPGFAAEPASVVGPPRMPRFPTGFHQVNNAIDKDWSQTLGSGTTASSSVTTIAATLSSSNVSNSSSLTVDGVTFYASPPAAATATIVVECTGSGCAGTTTDPSLISHTSKLVIGGVTYTFAATGASLSSSALISNGSTSGPDADLMAENIEAAINDTASQCGSPSGSGCFYTGSGGITAANTYVTATVSANTITLTAKTPGTVGNGSSYAFACTQGSHTAFDAPAGTTCSSSATDLTGGSYGTTSGTSNPPTFAYETGTGYDTGAALATQIATAINANPTVSAVLTAAGTGTTTGTLTLAPKAAGTGGNVTLSDSQFTAITTLGSNLTGGAPATVQPNAFPAKWGASMTSVSCANDYVVYPTGAVGATAAANIIAFNNLYPGSSPGCGTTGVPAAYWAYNTGTGYAVTTSPIIYQNTANAGSSGTMVAYIQSNGATADLVVVKFANNTGKSCTTCSVTSGSPTLSSTTSGTFTAAMVGDLVSGTDIPAGAYISGYTSGTSVTLSANATGTAGPETVTIYAPTITSPAQLLTSANITTCTAPCQRTVQLAQSKTDTYSSPFYDEASDTLFVGDDGGYLHQFAGVFLASTTPSDTAVQISSNPLASPVYDTGTGCVFVGDTVGYLYSVDSGTSGTACKTTFGTKLATSKLLSGGVAGDGILDGPILDPWAETVYAFVTYGASITGSGTGSGACTASDNCVFEFNASQSGASIAPVWAESIGAGAPGYNLYAGSFDNVYYGSATPTGNLYVVGNTGVTTGASLYQIPITSSAMGAPTARATGLTASGAYPWPSPLSEFCNGTCAVSGGATTSGTDYVFFSVNEGTASSCTNAAGNGCILSYSVNSPGTIALKGDQNYANVGSNGCWATGGIVVDNDATTTGSSEIYFVSLNGAEAGGANDGTLDSSNCSATAATAPTLQAVQALQINP